MDGVKCDINFNNLYISGCLIEGFSEPATSQGDMHAVIKLIMPH